MPWTESDNELRATFDVCRLCRSSCLHDPRRAGRPGAGPPPRHGDLVEHGHDLDDHARRRQHGHRHGSPAGGCDRCDGAPDDGDRTPTSNGCRRRGRAFGLPSSPAGSPRAPRPPPMRPRRSACDVGQIVKSLIFAVDGEVVLAYVSGANQLDEKKLARPPAARSARRVDADAVYEATGFPIGGVPPFGHADRCGSSSTPTCCSTTRSGPRPAPGTTCSDRARPSWCGPATAGRRLRRVPLTRRGTRRVRRRASADRLERACSRPAWRT